MVEIRPADGADTNSVLALWTEAYFTEGEGGRDAPYGPSDLKVMAGATHFLVAELDGAVIGVVALLSPGAPGAAVAGPGEAELVRLAIASRARRRGAGRALAERCAELAHENGWSSIALWSRPYQTAAHRLYESLGYERQPERDSADATGHARLVFRLSLR